MIIKCIVSGKDADAICMFCGRGISKDHAQVYPYFMSVYVGANETPKAIVTADAIWCGQCRPQPEPVEMPDLY